MKVVLLRKLAARLPERWQNELRRIHYRRQILKGKFATSEPEYKILHQIIKPGDWVIDIGANVGHYTKKFSELVGESGRVISFEPVPATFSLLAANSEFFANKNVTLFNAAVSEKFGLNGIDIPFNPNGLNNYYEARVSLSADSVLKVLTVSIDSLEISKRISLIKIDVEGHEKFVLNGMMRLLRKYHPVLIVETSSNEVVEDLSGMGYVSEKLPNSPNLVFRPTT